MRFLRALYWALFSQKVKSIVVSVLRKTLCNCYSFSFSVAPTLPVCYTFQCLCSSLSVFFSLLLSWYVFLGVGQRGVVVYHGLVWVRAAVVRPAERAAETPALCAPSRRSVSNHGNHFIYQDQSASTHHGPKIIRQNHAMLKSDTCPPSFHLKWEVELLYIMLFAGLSLHQHFCSYQTWMFVQLNTTL